MNTYHQAHATHLLDRRYTALSGGEKARLLFALEGLPDPWAARIAGTQAREYLPLKLAAPEAGRQIAVALEE